MLSTPVSCHALECPPKPTPCPALACSLATSLVMRTAPTCLHCISGQALCQGTTCCSDDLTCAGWPLAGPWCEVLQGMVFGTQRCVLVRGGQVRHPGTSKLSRNHMQPHYSSSSDAGAQAAPSSHTSMCSPPTAQAVMQAHRHVRAVMRSHRLLPDQELSHGHMGWYGIAHHRRASFRAQATQQPSCPGTNGLTLGLTLMAGSVTVWGLLLMACTGAVVTSCRWAGQRTHPVSHSKPKPAKTVSQTSQRSKMLAMPAPESLCPSTAEGCHQ